MPLDLSYVVFLQTIIVKVAARSKGNRSTCAVLTFVRNKYVCRELETLSLIC